MSRYPEGWVEKPLKTLADIVQGSTPASNDSRYWSDEPTPFVWVTPADMNECGTIGASSRYITQEGYNSCGTQLVPEGSVVISTRAPIGKVNLASTQLCTNQGCKSLVPRDMEASYLYWAILNAKKDLILSGRGTTFMELSAYDLGHIKVPVPPKEEQRAIAALLDKECGAIDATVETLEEQVSILERYRASVIHEAVTCGLDPDAPTKPSGVDWIGDIPEGWALTKIKHKATICNGLDYAAEDLCDSCDEGSVLVVRSSNISNGTMVHSDDVYVNKKPPASTRLSQGDLVIVRANGSAALVGKSAPFTFDEPSVAGGFMLICRSSSNRYLRWVLQSDLLGYYRSQFETTTINRLSSSLLGNMLIPWPNDNAAQAIADYLAARTAVIDAVLDTKRKQLDVLKARRQSLIYEYVTGKHRVDGKEQA